MSWRLFIFHGGTQPRSLHQLFVMMNRVTYSILRAMQYDYDKSVPWGFPLETSLTVAVAFSKQILGSMEERSK